MNTKSRAEMGILESVAITEMWRPEEMFSDWLAEPDNLEFFGDKINLKLAEAEREVGVGKFSADIHCKDVENDCTAVIENQFGQTDHGHLGKLLTYAAGLDAVTVVWVAEEFRAEHRQAVDWCNEISRPDIHFFGVEIKLRKIGNSAIAPDFVVVSEPNDWAKTTRMVANLSEKSRLHHEYWTAFQEFCRGQHDDLGLNLRKPCIMDWMYFSLGHGVSGIAHGNIALRIKSIKVVILVDHKKNSYEHFQQLESCKEQIASGAPGLSFQWNGGPEKTIQTLAVSKDCAPIDRNDWSGQHRWLAESIAHMRKAIYPVAKEIANR